MRICERINRRIVLNNARIIGVELTRAWFRAPSRPDANVFPLSRSRILKTTRMEKESLFAIESPIGWDPATLQTNKSRASRRDPGAAKGRRARKDERKAEKVGQLFSGRNAPEIAPRCYARKFTPASRAQRHRFPAGREGTEEETLRDESRYLHPYPAQRPGR